MAGDDRQNVSLFSKLEIIQLAHSTKANAVGVVVLLGTTRWVADLDDAPKATERPPKAQNGLNDVPKK